MKSYFLNFLHTLRLVQASVFFAVAAGFIVFVQQIAVEKVTFHFLTEKPSLSHIFIDPSASQGSVAALESFVLTLPQVSAVNQISSEEGVHYLQGILNSKNQIDAEGIPIRLEVMFDRAISTMDRDSFEKKLHDFSLVDVVTFDSINKQNGIWSLISSMLIIGAVAVCMMFFLAIQRQFTPLFLENDIKLGLEIGVRYFVLHRWFVFAVVVMFFCGFCVACLQLLFQALVLKDVEGFRLFPSFSAATFLLLSWGFHHCVLDKKVKNLYTN